MSDDSERKYRMTLSLSVLKHLGFGLYSNVPAVLSEVVANAWDADARKVSIKIDPYPSGGKIIIQDDGHGMTVADANERYLHVGYERRKATNGARTPRLRRPVMGRKGIGKLSLFSIARTVEVHSIRESERHGFRMDVGKIEETIKDGDGGEYFPDPVSSEDVDLDVGTRIVLTNLKRQLHRSGKALRRRLARRFSIIGPGHRFEIELDGRPITIEDREYHDKVQYIWTFGDRGSEFASVATNLDRHSPRQGMIEVDGETFEVDGWIGTASEAGQLKDQDTKESINKIVIMVRDKLAQEDVLEDFGEGGVYSKYIIGEIHADFLDLDDKEDIATTSRQRIIEDDPRYEALRSKLLEYLKEIQSEWTDLRNAGGRDVAMEFAQIKEWYRNLNPDHKRSAERLFGKINRLPIDDESEKRQLFISGILAFESLRLRSLLHRLDEVSVENLGMLGEVFHQLDDLEASAYYQIAKDRLEVISKLTSLTDDNAKERALQEHLYKHLWLLDPSWERATHTERMESRIYNALDAEYESLAEEQREARLDIYYATTGNKHVIIELKRAARVLDTSDLYGQISKYQRSAKKVLRDLDRINEPLEFVCVVGRPLKDWDDNPDGQETSRRSLEALNARVVMYDQLIQNALEAYQDYVDRRDEVGRVYDLITAISSEDVQAIGQIPN
ncbi:MAG: ATP-binding protein [Gemmatimonadetes bacterium]|nr:ATP-binding protein [Gemmatimonadota bacterium]